MQSDERLQMLPHAYECAIHDGLSSRQTTLSWPRIGSSWFPNMVGCKSYTRIQRDSGSMGRRQLSYTLGMFYSRDLDANGEVCLILRLSMLEIEEKHSNGSLLALTENGLGHATSKANFSHIVV